MEEDGSSGALFEDVVFTLIPSEDMDDEQIDHSIQAIETSGGRYVPLRDSDQGMDDMENLTHIISTHVEFREYERAVELGIQIVKPTWIVQSIRKRKQASTRQHSPDPSQYFHDVVLTCAGIPEGDAENLQAGIIALGGQWSRALTALTTHLVAPDMGQDKCRLAQQRGAKCKIVLPHWFDDCLMLGKKIDEKPYMLPDPEIYRKNNSAVVKANLSPEHLEGATTASPSKLPCITSPSSPSEARKNLNAFMYKKLLLSQDLELSSHLLATLTKLIEHGGGIVTDNIDEADIYIGYFRDGPAYVSACRAGKEVANLSWLYHVINQNKYTNPLRKLFHYPLPPKGIPGFENMKISLSNYAGEARTYVENLIRYCGAEYTKTMKQDNTHLVTAHMHGEKCEAAQEWNVNILNHLWLEESYAKCAIQSMTNPRYAHFPVRTNLGDVTGQTSLDMKSVERVFFPKPRSPQKQRSPQKPKTVPQSSAITNGAAMHNDVEPDVPTTIAEGDEMEMDEEAVPKTQKKPRGRPPRSAAATPHAVDEEKENESPFMTSTGRASKAKALNTLHSQAIDIAQYQKEMKRKGGVTHGGRRASLAEEMSSPAPAPRTSRKRSSDEYDATAVGSELSDGETQAAPAKHTKKAKHAPSPALPPISYRMMVTGDDRWQENPSKESTDKNALRSLGVQLTQDPKDVDILVAPKILRTRKFVCALACAPLVVDTKFLDFALKQKKLNENLAMLKDRDGEERLGFTLTEAIGRAKVNQRRLFRGWTIFVTKDVHGGFDTYKDIINLNGGEAMLYAGRPGLSLRKRRESKDQGEDDAHDFVYLVSGKTDADMKLWSKFREIASNHGYEARIVTADWLLNAAMSQQVAFEEKWSLDEEKALKARSS